MTPKLFEINLIHLNSDPLFDTVYQARFETVGGQYDHSLILSRGERTTIRQKELAKNDFNNLEFFEFIKMSPSILQLGVHLESSAKVVNSLFSVTHKFVT